MNEQGRKIGLAPIIQTNSRVLILGSLPGDESLRLGQYYANPRNQFWRILGDCLFRDLVARYEERVKLLGEKGIALWDVLESAERSGSGDARIRNGKSNDLLALLHAYPGLQFIGLNGAKAAQLFQREYGLNLPGMAIRVLPSTSPVPGRNVLAYTEKLARWKGVFEEAGLSGA